MTRYLATVQIGWRQLHDGLVMVALQLQPEILFAGKVALGQPQAVMPAAVGRGALQNTRVRLGARRTAQPYRPR